MPKPPTKPRAPIVPAVCGEPAEDGQLCNLPKGHADPLKHTFIGPKREDDIPTEDIDADKTDELAAEVDQLNATTPPETIMAAAERIFGDELIKRPVIWKLAKIMGSLPVFEAEGRNAHFGYSFIKDTQISGAIRPRMAKEGLMVIPNVLEESWVETKTSRGGTSWVTKLKVEFTVIDANTGDSVSGCGFGYGDDSGDKGANKAMTAAMKYWLLKLFQIGGEDNEEDARADLRAANREAGSASDAGVQITDAKIEGIQRGGRSDKMTMTQKKQIFALYKDLDLTPESFALRIDQYVGDKLILPESGDEAALNKAMNDYLNRLGADDAGTLITGLVDEKDGRQKTDESDEELADIGDPGYGG